MEQHDRPDRGSESTDPEIILDRLSEQFGDEAIRSLAERFAVTLESGLNELDAGTVDGSAHRVAGIAGTLGFADVSRDWRILADGDLDVIDTLRRDSAEALAIIAARYGSTGQA